MDDQRREIPLSQNDLRQVTLFAATCARESLALFEAKCPTDRRPREATESAEAFAQGAKRTAVLRTHAWAALRAARESGDPVAADAARAASAAAGAAYLHPLATPHQVKHVLGSAVYQAHAFELAAGGDTGIGTERLRWAVDRASPTVREIVRRFPPVQTGRSRIGELFRELDQELRR
jgi:hypothetical protein